MIENPNTYCQLVCTKIAQYIKVIHNLELIRMNAEFLIDDFGKVWLYHATDIWKRELTDVPTDYTRMLS